MRRPRTSEAARASDALDGRARAFYVDVLRRLRADGVPFLIGGAYALERYTGVSRRVKDIDIFVRPADRDRRSRRSRRRVT